MIKETKITWNNIKDVLPEYGEHVLVHNNIDEQQTWWDAWFAGTDDLMSCFWAENPVGSEMWKDKITKWPMCWFDKWTRIVD